MPLTEKMKNNQHIMQVNVTAVVKQLNLINAALTIVGLCALIVVR